MFFLYLKKKIDIISLKNKLEQEKSYLLEIKIIYSKNYII